MDDPNKTYVDRWFVSSQPHEYQYYKDSIRKEFPGKSDQEVADAILACRKTVAPSEGRLRLTACIRKRLTGWS